MSKWEQLVFIIRHLDDVPTQWLMAALMVLAAILSLLIFVHE